MYLLKFIPNKYVFLHLELKIYGQGLLCSTILGFLALSSLILEALFSSTGCTKHRLYTSRMKAGWLPELGKGRSNRKCSEVRPNLYTLDHIHMCNHQVGKAQQRLYFLRRLKHAHLHHHLLTSFHQSAIESLPSSCCTTQDRKDLQPVVWAAGSVITTPSLRHLYRPPPKEGQLYC